jgi:hypothetical protein
MKNYEKKKRSQTLTTPLADRLLGGVHSLSGVGDGGAAADELLRDWNINIICLAQPTKLYK